LRVPSIPSLRLAFSPEWVNHDLWGLLSIKCVGTPCALEVHANVLWCGFLSYSAHHGSSISDANLNWSQMLKSTPVYPSASIFRTRHMQPSPSFQEFQNGFGLLFFWHLITLLFLYGFWIFVVAPAPEGNSVRISSCCCILAVPQSGPRSQHCCFWCTPHSVAPRHECDTKSIPSEHERNV
jgi:hypothetical protein